MDITCCNKILLWSFLILLSQYYFFFSHTKHESKYRQVHGIIQRVRFSAQDHLFKERGGGV